MYYNYIPFLFAKSYQDRLDCFNNILSVDLKASEIHKAWSEYLQLVIEPIGWKSIWRISREACESLKISFPCTVIVIVENVDFKDLSCQVNVIEIDSNIVNFPSTMSDVPLIELYPTKEQDRTIALEMLETAESVDSLRFFYHNLWMPWDLEFDDESSWVDSYLEGRLQLHYSMLELKVPEEVVNEVRRIVAEGYDIVHRMEELVDKTEGDSDLSPHQLLVLTELHNRLSQLKDCYSIYEKPNLLEAYVKRLQNNNEAQPDATVVLSTATPEQLSKLASYFPPGTKSLRFVQTLQEALVKTRAEGCVYVTEGEHPFFNLASLKTGGSITGVESGVTVIGNISGEDCPSLDLLKGCLTLSGLTLRMTSSWTMVKIRPDTKCSLKDVQLQGSCVTDGVDVHAGASFTATDCTFVNCQSALVCYPNSTVILSRCVFSDNSVAIELRDGCSFTMADCTISGSLVCAIKLSTSSLTVQLPTIQALNRIPNVHESGTISNNNLLDIQLAERTKNDTCNISDSTEKINREMECSF